MFTSTVGSYLPHPLYIGILLPRCFCVVIILLVLPDVDLMHFVTFLLLVKCLQLRIGLC